MNLSNQPFSVVISARPDIIPWASMSGVNTTQVGCPELCGDPVQGQEAWGILRTSLIVCLSVATCLTNCVVLIILRVNEGLHSVSSTFTSGVAIADLFIGLLIIPPNILDSSYPHIWNNSQPMYYVWVTLDYFLSITSILSMILLNLDRFWSITYPIKYIRLRTKRHAIMMIAVIWGIVFVIVTPFAAAWKYVYADEETVTARSNFVQYGAASWYFATGSVFVFIIPLCITCGMYFHIIKAIQKRSTMTIGRMSAGSLASRTSKKDSENPYLVSQSDLWHLQSLYEDAVNSSSQSSIPWNSRYISNNRTVRCYASIDEEAESDGQIKKSKINALENRNEELSSIFEGPTRSHKFETTVGSSSTSGVSKEPSGCVEASTMEPDGEISITQTSHEILNVTDLNHSDSRPNPHGCQNGGPNGAVTITVEGKTDHEPKIDKITTAQNGDVRSINNSNSQTQKRVCQRYLTRQGLSDSCLPRNGHTTRRMRGKLLPQGSDGNSLQLKAPMGLRPSASSPHRLCQLPGTTPLPSHAMSNGHATVLGNKRRDIKRNGDYFGSNASFRGSTGSVRARLRHSLTGLSGRGTKVLLILKRAQKAAKQLGVILTCFLICWMPYFAQVIVYAICPNCTNPKLMTVAVYMGYTHSLCNPILYITFNLRFRKAFQKLACPCYMPRRWYRKQAVRHGSREHQLSRLYSEAQL